MKCFCCCSSVAKSCPNIFDPMDAGCQASLSCSISQSLLKHMPSKSVMPSKYLMLCHPLLLKPSISLSIKVFSNGSALSIKWPDYWSFSFSISASNEYSRLFQLGLTGLISLQSKGLSRVFSNTTIRKYQFFGTQPSLQSNFQICPGLLKKPSFDYMDLCQQSDFFAF